MSRCIMEKMFDGVAEEDVTTMIQTIIKIEKNLRGCEDEEEKNDDSVDMYCDGASVFDCNVLS